MLRAIDDARRRRRPSTSSSSATPTAPTSGSPSRRWSTPPAPTRRSGRGSTTATAPRNLRRKAGNIADWVERWGDAYPFMLVLDADSLMEADTIIELARRMEADDTLGILQTSPQPDRRRDPARPRPAVRQPRLRPGADPRPARLVRQRRQLLGPQRHHPHPGLRRLRRPARAAGQAAVRRADPQPRLRRGRLRAPRRLGGAHGRRPRRQLRARAAEPDRARRPRPPLVPGQPAAHAACSAPPACTRSAGCTCSWG